MRNEISDTFKFLNKNYKKRIMKRERNLIENKGRPNYKIGELNPNSSVGFAFISQRVVAKTLGLDLINDCNCEFSFGFKYDLYDEGRYNKINVKACTSCDNIKYNFGLHNIFIPNTYICLGFSVGRKEILHVWIFDDFFIKCYEKNFINISSKNNYKEYEVDAKPYNNVYHNMSIKNCKILRKCSP